MKNNKNLNKIEKRLIKAVLDASKVSPLRLNESLHNYGQFLNCLETRERIRRGVNQDA